MGPSAFRDFVNFEQDPATIVIPDLKRFITETGWAKAEKISDEFHQKYPDPKRLHISEREKAGLDFVEAVVNMFVDEGMADEIFGLEGKSVPLLHSLRDQNYFSTVQQTAVTAVTLTITIHHDNY